MQDLNFKTKTLVVHMSYSTMEHVSLIAISAPPSLEKPMRLPE